MSKKKQKVMTPLQQKYVDLSLKTYNNINYDDLFKRLSIELDIEEQIIRDYANRIHPLVVDNQLPPEPEPKKLEPHQEMARNLLTPNRSEENKARHVTVMSEAASELLEKESKPSVKGSSKIRDAIFRQ